MGKSKIEKNESTDISNNKYDKKNNKGIKFVKNKNKKITVNDGTKKLRKRQNRNNKKNIIINRW